MNANPRLVVLNLLLKTLEVDGCIETVDDRKRVQKAVYLAQVAGADIGYRFSWYLMGPYSRSLTEDYFALDACSTAIELASEGKSLPSSFQDSLNKIKPAFKKPSTVTLSDEQWLELLASYHYLRFVSKRSHESATEVILKQKPELHPFVDDARRILDKYIPLPS